MQRQQTLVLRRASHLPRRLPLFRNFNTAAFTLACAITAPAQVNSASTNEPVRLPEVLVQGREDSLIGVAEAASQGTVGAAQLERRPLSRPGEVLETVRGFGYRFRGDALDRGSDATERSHARAHSVRG